MNRIDNSGQGIASLGRDEDQYMAHVAQGEMVVPPVISQETRQRIEQEMKAAGLSPNEYTVGDGMSINPITGQPEFGWLKKTFKSIKKVAKKVAPIATLIPGVGTALGGVLGGLGGSIGSAFGLKGTLAKNFLGKIAGAGIPGLSSIAGGASGGYSSIASGLGSLFGGAGGQEETMYKDQFGNIISAEEYEKMNEADKSLYNKIQNSNFLQKIFGGGNQEGGILNLLGGNNQGGGMDPKMFALALALGQATKKSAEERAGGLSQTPEVTMDALGRYSMANTLGTGGTREEFGLSAAPKSFSPEVFAAMGGPIDRQYFNKGGIAAVRELDMRDGGESAGPGTGTSDDIPAMLSDGEFVMTAKATRGAGAFDLNKTKSGIELISGGNSSREKGVENMRELMDIFEAI
jgi:hypothetical protein